MADIYGIAFNIMGGPALRTLKQMAKETENVGRSAKEAQENTQEAIDANISKLGELNRKIAATYALAKKLKDNRDLKAAELVYKRGDALEEERIKLLETLGAQEDLSKKGFGGGATQGKSFIKTLGSVTKALGVATIAAAGFKAAMNMSKEGETLLYLAHSAGISAGSFQRAAAASELYGGSKEGVAGMMSGLMKMRQDLLTGQTNQNGLTEAARKYGISIFNKNGQLLSPEAILRNTAAVMSRWDKGAQLDIKSLLGLDEGTFNLMLEGYDKYIATLKAAKSLEISEEDLQKLREASKAFKKLSAIITTNLMKSAAEAAPFLEGFADTLAILFVGLKKGLEGLFFMLFDWYFKLKSYALDKGKSVYESFKNAPSLFNTPAQIQEALRNGQSLTNFTPWPLNFGGKAGGDTTNNIGIIVQEPGKSVEESLRSRGIFLPFGGELDRTVRDLNEGVAS